MRATQGFFPRLKDDTHYEENGERHVTLHLVCLLHNFKATCVSMNKITNYFMPHLSLEIYFLVMNAI